MKNQPQLKRLLSAKSSVTPTTVNVQIPRDHVDVTVRVTDPEVFVENVAAAYPNLMLIDVKKVKANLLSLRFSGSLRSS